MTTAIQEKTITLIFPDDGLIDEERLDHITELTSGVHAEREDGMCVMEATAYVAGEIHYDRPQCVCQQITNYAIFLNDTVLPDDQRNQLIPYIPRMIGTRTADIRVNRERFDIAEAARARFLEAEGWTISSQMRRIRFALAALDDMLAVS